MVILTRQSADVAKLLESVARDMFSLACLFCWYGRKVEGIALLNFLKTTVVIAGLFGNTLVLHRLG